MFQVLTGHFKENFLRSNNQINVLVELCMCEEENEFNLDELCPCGSSVKKVLYSAFGQWQIFF